MLPSPVMGGLWGGAAWLHWSVRLDCRVSLLKNPLIFISVQEASDAFEASSSGKETLLRKFDFKTGLISITKM